MGIRTIVMVAALCGALVMPGAVLASSFTEFTSGVKALTESAKDVNEINQSNKQAPAQKKTAPAKKSTKKAPAPKAESRVRGG